MASNLDLNRRAFLKGAASFTALLPAVARAQFVAHGRFSPEDLPLARERLLNMVNDERRSHGLSSLQLDQFACEVGDRHAKEMVEEQYLSHWGRDGSKPYHRYSFAGGTDAISENVSSNEGTVTMTRVAAIDTLIYMHQTMIDETPPDDGHRRTILLPYHTHVGFGIAVREHSVRLDEIFVARYTNIDPVVRQAAPGANIRFSGRLLTHGYELKAIDIYYEPLPARMPLEWLRTRRSYGLPDTFKRLLPRLSDDLVYLDGTRGVIERGSKGTFRTRITLFKEPGINTIVVWLREPKNAATFPATQVCIRAE